MSDLVDPVERHHMLVQLLHENARLHRQVVSLVRWVWFQRIVMAIVLLAFAARALFAQQLPIGPEGLHPAAAVAAALADVQAAGQVDPTFPIRFRYVMANVAAVANDHAVGYAANTALNFAGDAYRPAAIPVAGGTLYRLDLAQYAGFDERRFRTLADAWDRMQDTQFYLPTDGTREVSAPRFTHGGRAWNRVTVRVVVPAAHADAGGQLASLIAATQSTTPIVSLGQFLRFSLGTADGGLYYAFRGIEASPAKGTAEQAFLLRAGVNLDDFGARNVDQRVVLMRTPNPNVGIIEYMPSTGTRPSVGPSIVTITRDFFEGPIRADKHALENLADRRHDGSEVIIPKADGGLEFALFDGAGGLVNEAPPNLAADRKLPTSGPARLHGAISCIRCHGPAAMYHPAPNYVSWLRAIRVNGQQFDVFTEKGDSGKALQRLVSLYNGDTTEAFAVARITHARFAIAASGAKVEDATAATAAVYDRWMYSFDPKLALETLGYIVADNAAAVAAFNVICPPAPEPLRVTTLRGWSAAMPMRITVDDWLAVYAEVALRVRAWESSRPSPPKRGPVQGPPLPIIQGNIR